MFRLLFYHYLTKSVILKYLNLKEMKLKPKKPRQFDGAFLVEYVGSILTGW